MAPDSTPRSVFINYRRADTGWAATMLADALRRRLGPSSDVFLDNQSIGLGEVFARSLEDGVRRSAVLVALIGPLWDQPPLVDRLRDPKDWVRTEILLAKELAEEGDSRIIPVLVDRPHLPVPQVLPDELRFLTDLQAGRTRQDNPDLDRLADRIAARLPDQPHLPTRPLAGVEPTRTAIEAFLRRTLPPAQQWSGNRNRLVDLALAVLSRDDRLAFLAPCRINNGPKGSAAVLVTGGSVVVVEVNEEFLLKGEIVLPRRTIQRVEVVPTLPLFADAVVHTTAGDAVRLQGMFRDQARQFADHLRA